MKIWIAKDNTSAALTTIFTGSKPVLGGEGFWWQPNEGNCQSLYDFMFPYIKNGECKEFFEIKEVDLEKEIEKELETRWRGEYLFTSKFRESAKHFFELGLKASQPTTYVYGIEEALKENGIDPDSKEADIYREAIYKIYDRLKAQKGENV